MNRNLEKAQKAFAFFISSTTNEGAVAFDKLRELRVSLDDVAYHNTDGSWLTRWGNLQFDMGSGSSDSVDREQQKQHEREIRQAEEQWNREYEQNVKREQAEEHKHYADIAAHQKQQYENHEAFNRSEGYIGSDGEYHLFSEMTWNY